MKRILPVISMLLLLVSCDNSNFVIRGLYKAAPDGMVVYMSPYIAYDINDVMVPVDSAIVKDGYFEFMGTANGSEVCFISSSRIYDGGYVVVEPGEVNFDMADRTFRAGTPNNDLLHRFLSEKERVIAIRGMCDPAIINVMQGTEELRDSLAVLSSLAGMVFDMFAVKAISENIDNNMGHFFLTQSAGVASPEKLLPLYEQVPEQLRDVMYKSRLTQLNNTLDAHGAVELYRAYAEEAAMNTSVGRKFLDFEMDDVKGCKRLFSDIVKANRYTILCFWGAWEEKALSALKSLENAAALYNANGLELVAVSLDSNIDECNGIVSSNSFSGIYLYDANGGSAEVASAYGIVDLPYMLLINDSGTVLVRTPYFEDISSKLRELF